MLRVALSLVVVASFACKKKDPPPKVTPPTVEEAEAFAKTFAAHVTPCNKAELDRSVDYDAFVSRATIDHALSKRERDEFRKGASTAFSATLCDQLANSKYTYLRTQILDGAPRPLFRVVDADGAFNYHQLELDKRGGTIRAVDIYFYASGENMSETFRNLTNTLIDHGGLGTTVSMKRMKQLMSEGKYAEARELLHGLPAAVRKTKAAMLIEVQLTSESIDNPEYLAAIDAYGKAFPNDPSLDLVLLDAVFLRKKYDESLAILDRIDKRVGGDPYLDAMRAGVLGEAGEHAEAIAAAKRAIEREPELETAWWQLLTQQAAAKEYTAALATIETLIDKFEAPIDAEALAADERFTGLAASKELAGWAAARQADVPD